MIFHGQPPASGEVEAFVLVVWVRRSWADSIEVWRRERFTRPALAVNWARQCQARLARRHDVLLTGSLFYPRGRVPLLKDIASSFRGRILAARANRALGPTDPA